MMSFYAQTYKPRAEMPYNLSSQLSNFLRIAISRSRFAFSAARFSATFWSSASIARFASTDAVLKLRRSPSSRPSASLWLNSCSTRSGTWSMMR